MGAIGRELVRLAKERVIMYERALDQMHPRDPQRDDLVKALNDARASLAGKMKMLRDDEN